MPDFSMFGGGGGVSDAIKDQHAQALTALSQGQTAAIPSQIDLHIAQARHATASAGITEEELRQVMGMGPVWAEAMSGAGKGEMPSPSVVFGRASLLAFQKGYPMQGMSLAEKQNQFLGHETSAAHAKIQLLNEQLKQSLHEFDVGDRLLEGVHDQASQDKATEEWHKQPGLQNEPAPWEGTEYKPENIKRIRSWGLGQRDKTNEEIKRLQLELQAARDRDTSESRKTLNDIRQKMADLAGEREQRLAKGGGKAYQASVADVKHITDMLREDHPGIGVENPEMRRFIDSVAYDASTIRKQNPAISPEVARNQAYTARSKELVFEDTWYNKLGVGSGSGTPKFLSTKTGTKGEPHTMTEERNRTQGRWYRFDDGRVMKWDPKGNAQQPWTDE